MGGFHEPFSYFSCSLFQPHSSPSQSPPSDDSRVCLPKNEHGAVRKDLPGPVSILLLLQIFLLLALLEVVTVNVVH